MDGSSHLSQRKAGLTPEKRALLEKWSRKKTTAASRLLAIPHRTSQETLPLSFAQQRFWFLDQLEPANPAHQLLLAIGIHGKLNHITLRESLQEMVRRHEILRTHFVSVEDRPVQVIDTVDTSLCFRDVVEVSSIAEVVQLAQAELHTPFRLDHGSLLRVRLLCLTHEEHILLLTMHHSIADGWSLNIIVRELATLYAAFSENHPSPLAALPIQYADFALWQRQQLQGRELEKLAAYWRQQLSGVFPMLELPTDYPRPALQTFQGAEVSFDLEPALITSIQTLSQREGYTHFMILLAAFFILLHRYSLQSNVLVGVPVAGRTHIDTEALIGPFVNTLVLRANFSEHLTFSELLKQVRETTLQAYAHQALPFEKLVEFVQPERHLGYSPIFQVMFSFQNTVISSQEAAGLRWQQLKLPSGTAQVDLTLALAETGEGIVGDIEYNTALFRAATIERMAVHLRNILDQVLSNPTLPIAAVSLLSSAEQDLIVRQWNQTCWPLPAVLNLSQLIEAQVERTPDAVALVCEEKTISYRALNRSANQLATYLNELGIGSERSVGICLPRGINLVVALLAVLKAGGAYVPLDPTYPAERLAFMLRDAQVTVLLTERRLSTRMAGAEEMQCIYLDCDWPLLRQLDDQNPSRPFHAAQLAYTIYTSGSTGKPKGVQIAHSMLANFLQAMCQQPGIQSTDKLLAVTTPSFDIAGLELYLPLLVGACVVLASGEIVADGIRLREQLLLNAVTMMQATPVTWRLLLEAGWPGADNLRILCGGEAWSKELAQALLSRSAELWNMYGPTETTIWSTIQRIHTAEEAPPLGRPIAHTQTYILDARLDPVPIGVAGELYIGGVGVARGYMGRPDLTAEKFLPDPFSGDAGLRLYRTGDLARYRADGTIEYLGRLDQQVKIRGFRIEPGEIEAVLLTHPAVREALVVAREDLPDDKRLVAYLVAAQQERIAPSSSDLHLFLAGRLPPQCLPSHFVWLTAIPLTANGKRDRRALPAPTSDRPQLATHYQAPQSSLEDQLCQIWQQVLQLEQVGVQDNFFELGGHSLLLVQVHNRIRQVLGQQLTVVELFEYPTIRALAIYLSRTRKQPGIM